MDDSSSVYISETKQRNKEIYGDPMITDSEQSFPHETEDSIDESDRYFMRITSEYLYPILCFE
jgi:hypothetical protein